MDLVLFRRHTYTHRHTLVHRHEPHSHQVDIVSSSSSLLSLARRFHLINCVYKKEMNCHAQQQQQQQLFVYPCVCASEQRLALIWGCFKSYWLRLSLLHCMRVLAIHEFACACVCLCLCVCELSHRSHFCALAHSFLLVCLAPPHSHSSILLCVRVCVCVCESALVWDWKFPNAISPALSFSSYYQAASATVSASASAAVSLFLLFLFSFFFSVFFCCCFLLGGWRPRSAACFALLASLTPSFSPCLCLCVSNCAWADLNFMVSSILPSCNIKLN